MNSSSSERWEIFCPSEKIAAFRNDERLVALLTLARIVNSMRFTQVAVISVTDESTPSNKRQRMNSFLYLGALLYEGLKFTETLGKHFRNLKSFKEGFQEIQRDENVKELIQSLLDPVRNRIVFHYDGPITADSLQTIDFSDYVFATSHGETRCDVYYELADQTIVHFLIRPYKNQEEMEQRFKDFVKRTADLSRRFGDAADKLIAEGLKMLGWRFRKLPGAEKGPAYQGVQ